MEGSLGSDQRQPHAFISYSHADKGFVRALVVELQRLGVGVWIDEVELVIGDSLVERLGDAISESDFLIAVISPNSLESGWCHKELALATTQGINQKRVKVLAIRLDHARMPSFLEDSVWGDGDLHTPAGLAAELAVAMDRHLDPVVPLPSASRDSDKVLGSPGGSPTIPAQTTLRSGPRGQRPWRVKGAPRSMPSSGRDASGFAWILVRGEETRRVVIWISGSAMASRDAGLPTDVAQAKRTKGGSVVTSLLDLESPPSRCSCRPTESAGSARSDCGGSMLTPGAQTT